jgi:hypothetical protein
MHNQEWLEVNGSTEGRQTRKENTDRSFHQQHEAYSTHSDPQQHECNVQCTARESQFLPGCLTGQTRFTAKTVDKYSHSTQTPTWPLLVN